MYRIRFYCKVPRHDCSRDIPGYNDRDIPGYNGQDISEYVFHCSVPATLPTVAFRTRVIKVVASTRHNHWLQTPLITIVLCPAVRQQHHLSTSLLSFSLSGFSRVRETVVYLCFCLMIWCYDRYLLASVKQIISVFTGVCPCFVC